MFTDKSKEIQQVIHNYFDGIYEGDVPKLRSAFSPSAILYGDIKGTDYLKSVEEYLDGVVNRQSPRDLQEDMKMEILGLEVIGNVAIAKLRLPMLGYNYYDFLSLTKIEGEWKIVNKLFAHVE